MRLPTSLYKSIVFSMLLKPFLWETFTEVRVVFPVPVQVTTLLKETVQFIGL